MSELGVNEESLQKEQSRIKIFLPLLIISTLIVIAGFFYLGYVNLGTPVQPPEDIHSLLEKKQQEREQKSKENVEDDTTEDSTDVVVNEDGTFDFAKYRYFSFPLPFVVNFADNNGMVTVEIAIATYATTLRGEALIDKLTEFAPKIRSEINIFMAEQVYNNLNSVKKRKEIEKKLLDIVRPIIEEPDPDKTSGITGLHFTKFVITGKN